jgi:hypothetical protein
VSKKTVFKVAGFIGTLGAGAALVASAAAGTGAWFTDSENGSLASSTGSLQVNLISGTRNMSFQNLMPGDYKTQSVTYQVHQSSGKSDVWLVLDPTNVNVLAFTGDKHNSLYEDGGLGRYGHFKVTANGSQVFVSNNLAHAEDPSDPAQCHVNADGHGGSSAKPASETDTIDYCGVPYAIKLASGLNDGNTGNVALEFGVTGRWTAQNITLPTVPFSIVATQAGHRPDAGNF